MMIEMTLAPGQYIYLEFGVHQISEEHAYIFAYKYYDPDLDGIWDPEEPGVEGWNITAAGVEHEAWKLTDAEGGLFFVVDEGNYTISEETRKGWFSTTPYIVNLTVELGEMYHVHFGNARTSEIVVYKFLDADEDGQWDDGEYPIRNWHIYIMKDESLVGEGWTDENGRAIIDGLLPGTYLVKEDMQAEWNSTIPTEYNVTLGSGDSREVRFGNLMTHPSICVMKTGPYQVIWGNNITWEITMWNCGNSPLVNVWVNDSRLGLREYIDHMSLGETRTFLVNEYIPIGYEDDWVENNVTAIGWADHETMVRDRDVHAIFIVKPVIEINKTGPETAERGDKVTFVITVTNSGNVELRDIMVYDGPLDLQEYIPILMPGQSVVYTLDFIIPLDWELGHLTNWVSAEGTYHGTILPVEYEVEDRDCHEIDILGKMIEDDDGPCSIMTFDTRKG
jgi:hypothetical protein